jgi:hypothetical protein
MRRGESLSSFFWREKEMKDVSKEINYKGQTYHLVFNLNVMEAIQQAYKSIEQWGEMTDGKATGEPDAKAVIFGFHEMLNEGIDIDNEENGTDIKPFTLKQVGRMITEIGLMNATKKLNETVVDSTKSDDSRKNV